MSVQSQPITAITHPLVSSIFIKKDFGNDLSKYHEDVLVIETNFNHENTQDDTFNMYLVDLLSDLHDLQVQAEEKIGKFDRVDIRTH